MESKRKTKKITVRFPKRLKAEMQASLIKSGYGLHGKSRWLKEAIESFLSRPDYIDYVDHGLDINQPELTEVEAFYLDTDTINLLKDAFMKIRVNDPLFEGVKSALIRAAVIGKLTIK